MEPTREISDLRSAARTAVELSLKLAADLKAETLEFSERLLQKSQATAEQCRIILEKAPGSKLAEDVAEMVSTTAFWQNRLRKLFEDQERILDTFNIVLFGRTGTGKSTLIEAMTRGDGQTVSPVGRGDYTVEVSHKLWEGCKIYDTPGINGWGASESRSTLEARAREAVEVADFVIVCFDSFAQQLEEFRKLADWINIYNKPLIAVVNNKNSLWKFPERVPYKSDRELKALEVRQHNAHISAELQKIGIVGAPIVTLHSQRALFALVNPPLKGSNVLECTRLRSELGIARLLENSNFPVLEKLLSSAIKDHAIDLRTGVLNDLVRGECERLAKQLTDDIATKESVVQLREKDYFEPMLDLIGYPMAADEDKRRWFFHESLGCNLLDEVEKMRNGPFTSKVKGSFREFLESKTSAGSELDDLKQESLNAASKLIDEAFGGEGKEITEETFNSACFKQQAITEASEKALNDALDFLRRRTRIVVTDYGNDLDQKTDVDEGISVSFSGKRARYEKIAGICVQTGGIITGIGGAVLFTIVGTNFWNPIGWTAIGLAIGSVLLNLLGKWLIKIAKKRRLAQRQQAIVDSREVIGKQYENVTKSIFEIATPKLKENSQVLLVAPLAEQLCLLRSMEIQKKLVDELLCRQSHIPFRNNPQQMLASTLDHIEREAFPDAPNRGSLVWMGESWIDDPVNRQEEPERRKIPRCKVNDPSILEQLSATFDTFFGRKSFETSCAGKEWLDKVISLCKNNGEDMEVFRALETIQKNGKPQVFLIGDYNSGKTSFIKRIFIDDNKQVPKGLKIMANPTTNEVTAYDWDGIDLIDTPGFQSSNLTHTELTLREFSSASLLFYFFHPNLVIGDETALNQVLNGDCLQGMLPKKNRTLFIINRADQLGCEPTINPGHFKERVKQKRSELAMALAKRGIEVSTDDISCISSDPYGKMGDRNDISSALFDPFRKWDGINGFFKGFRKIKPDLLKNGLDRSLLEGGYYTLTSIVNFYQSFNEKQRERHNFQSSLYHEFTKILEDGKRESNTQHNKLKKRIEAFAENLVDECLVVRDGNQMKEMAEKLGKWWAEPVIEKDIDDWEKDAIKAFNDWSVRTADRTSRLVTSREFNEAYDRLEEKPFDYQPPSQAFQKLGSGLNKAGQGLKALGRDGVYAIGKAMKVKFKPWAPTNLSKVLGKAGIVLVWVGVAIDIVDLIYSNYQDQKLEDARLAARKSIRETIPKVVDWVAQGTDENPGVVRSFRTYLNELTEEWKKVREDCDELQKGIVAIDERIAIYRELLTEAETHLNRTCN